MNAVIEIFPFSNFCTLHTNMDGGSRRMFLQSSRATVVKGPKVVWYHTIPYLASYVPYIRLPL